MTIEFISFSITADEDSSFLQCEATLTNAADYINLKRDDSIVIHILGVDYHFIVDTKSINRTISDSGDYNETCTISGLSPLVKKSKPRSLSITKTWETPNMASAIVEELLGPVTWNLVDWMIPAYRLAAEKASPLDVALQIVQAAGGLLESQPDGSVVCRHRWPTSIENLNEPAPDKILYETEIYSASENSVNDELVNRIRIGQDESFQDRLEYVPNKSESGVEDPYRGIMYAFISPWRTGLRIVTTRPSMILVGSAFEGVRTIHDSNPDYPSETITFLDRESSTQYPIMSLTEFEWLDEDLGGLLVTPYSTQLKSGSGNYSGHSLGRISYTARYLAVPVTCTKSIEEIEAQFLLLENQHGN